MTSRAARLSRLSRLSTLSTLAAFRGRTSAPIATLTMVAFLATFAPPRTARAGFETSEPADTPNFAHSSNGTKGGAEEAGATTKATKARKTPVSSKGGFTTSVPFQRYYGLDPFLGRTARITNELGTHSWLLVREEDRHGNYVAYTWNASESNRVNRAIAQTLPVLQRVEWGGNRLTALAPPFRADMTHELRRGRSTSSKATPSCSMRW